MKLPRRLRNFAAAVSLLGTLAAPAYALTSQQAAAEQAKLEYLAGTTQIVAPHSSRKTEGIYTLRGTTGVPALDAILMQDGATPATDVPITFSPASPLGRDPAAAQQPTMTMQTAASTVKSSAENAIQITGNPDGAGSRTLVSNTGTASSTLRGSAVANLGTNYTAYTKADQGVEAMVPHAVRFLACDGACGTTSTYSTNLFVRPDTTAGTYAFTGIAHDASGSEIGRVTGDFTAPEGWRLKRGSPRPLRA